MRDRGELIGVHSKDAQKQLARTSLSRHWRPCDRQVSALSLKSRTQHNGIDQ